MPILNKSIENYLSFKQKTDFSQSLLMNLFGHLFSYRIMYSSILLAAFSLGLATYSHPLTPAAWAQPLSSRFTSTLPRIYILFMAIKFNNLNWWPNALKRSSVYEGGQSRISVMGGTGYCRVECTHLARDGSCVNWVTLHPLWLSTTTLRERNRQWGVITLATD